MTGKLARSSGILLHPTSLPGRYGIGTFNHLAYAFVDLLQAADQTVWQILPLGPTGYGDSPYACRSSFAGNIYMISLEDLVDRGLLDSSELEDIPDFDEVRVDYSLIDGWKVPLLKKVAAQHHRGSHEGYAEFCKTHQIWLDDYALFRAIAQQNPDKAWNKWDLPLRRRQPEAMAKAREELADLIGQEKFLQFLFYSQWEALKSYANERGVKIFGDLPIFAALDSADAWCHPELFFFNEDMEPTRVAGVPPDVFSADGQLWGNPLYNWDEHKKTKYKWWSDRLKACFELYDIVRIDHFRGFAGYWEVQASETTARNGRWVKGPGHDLFKALKALGDRAIIAEDLGEITPDVIELRDSLKLPGMKILQFGFGSGSDNPFLPHNHEPNFVVYTGTHDNNTVMGWFDNDATESEKEFFLRYTRFNDNTAAKAMIRCAMESVCFMAVTPMQDLLELGNEARMNFPGQMGTNWAWRMRDDALDASSFEELKQLTRLYGRAPVPEVEQPLLKGYFDLKS